MRSRRPPLCAHCGTTIRYPQTMVVREGRSFCCRNCAEAEREAALREQLELELGETSGESDT